MPLPSSLHTGGEYIVLFLFDVANITSSNISISFLLRQQMQTDTNNNTPTNNNNNNTIIIIIYRPSFIVHRLSCVVVRRVLYRQSAANYLMQYATINRVVQLIPIAVPSLKWYHRHRDDDKHNNTLYSKAPRLHYCRRRSGENDIILTIIHNSRQYSNNNTQSIRQFWERGICMGIWVKIHFLQIYYATINCILFWGWGVPHMDCFWHLFCFVWYLYVGKNRHWTYHTTNN